jgi:hypothetical protein
MFNDFYFRNRAVYEIKWNNVVECGRTQITIWRMRIACWVPKVTNTNSEYVILIAILLQQWMHYVTLYMHYLSCLQYCPRVALVSFIFVTSRYLRCLIRISLTPCYTKFPKNSCTYVWLYVLLRFRANSLTLSHSTPNFIPIIFLAKCMVKNWYWDELL